MEIVVCVKQIQDTRLPVEASERNSVVQKEPWPVYVMNPADRSALEEAMRLRDQIVHCHVTAITLGPASAEAVLAQSLARGADSVVHLVTEEADEMDSFSVAQALGAFLGKQNFDLVLCGNKTEDGGSAEVGPVLAEALNVPQITNVVRMNIGPQDQNVTAERKLERGYRQLVEAQLPALLTIEATACEPRYLTVRAIRDGERRLAQDCKRVSVSGADLHGPGPLSRRVVSVGPPRPRPKKIAQPDAEMSAEERMAMLMSGGMPTRSSQRSTGGAESLADEIIAFLQEKGLLEC